MPLASASFAVSASLATALWAPSFAYMHGRPSNELRPMATAITLFAFNIVGMWLEPTVVDAFSDQLAATHGACSIGVALNVIQVCGVWAAFHCWNGCPVDGMASSEAVIILRLRNSLCDVVPQPNMARVRLKTAMPDQLKFLLNLRHWMGNDI
jgi:hypothetical protein